jgi:hypothetical protein
MAAKSFTDRLMEAASDALTYPPQGPTQNGRPIFSPVAQCPVCGEMTYIEFPCCNELPQEDGE